MGLARWPHLIYDNQQGDFAPEAYQDPSAPDVKIAVRDANADAANASAESPAVMDDFDAKHSSWAQSGPLVTLW